MNTKLLALLASTSVVGVCSGAELFNSLKSLKSLLDHYKSILAHTTPGKGQGIEMSDWQARSTEAQHGSPRSQIGSPVHERIMIGNVPEVYTRSSRSSQEDTPFSSPEGVAKRQGGHDLGSGWGSPSPLQDHGGKKRIALEEGGLFGTSSPESAQKILERSKLLADIERDSLSIKIASNQLQIDALKKELSESKRRPEPSSCSEVPVPAEASVTRALFDDMDQVASIETPAPGAPSTLVIVPREFIGPVQALTLSEKTKKQKAVLKFFVTCPNPNGIGTVLMPVRLFVDFSALPVKAQDVLARIVSSQILGGRVFFKGADDSSNAEPRRVKRQVLLGVVQPVSANGEIEEIGRGNRNYTLGEGRDVERLWNELTRGFDPQVVEEDDVLDPSGWEYEVSEGEDSKLTKKAFKTRRGELLKRLSRLYKRSKLAKMVVERDSSDEEVEATDVWGEVGVPGWTQASDPKVVAAASSALNAEQGVVLQDPKADAAVTDATKKTATPANYRQAAVNFSRLGIGIGSIYLTWKYRNALLSGASVKINGTEVPIAGLMLGGLVTASSLVESLAKQANTKTKK